MIPDNEAEPTMTREEVLQHYRESGALLEGHFLLTSGLHSPVYMQSARVLMHPERAEALCKALAAKICAAMGPKPVDLVCSPAMGGVVVGYELARQLGVPSIFTERVEGVFALRRGFEIPQGARVLMAEDVVTTGKSSRECIECIEANGGKVVAASCIVDRSDGEVQLGVPLFTLCGFKVPSYREDELPPELQKLPAVKPGSRGLK
jgi:orotate phosphoribosyltransferase